MELAMTITFLFLSFLGIVLSIVLQVLHLSILMSDYYFMITLLCVLPVACKWLFYPVKKLDGIPFATGLVMIVGTVIIGFVGAVFTWFNGEVLWSCIALVILLTHVVFSNSAAKEAEDNNVKKDRETRRAVLENVKQQVQERAIELGYSNAQEMIAEQNRTARIAEEAAQIKKGKKMIQQRSCNSCGGSLSIVDGDFVCEYCGSYYGSVKQIVTRT